MVCLRCSLALLALLGGVLVACGDDAGDPQGDGGSGSGGDAATGGGTPASGGRPGGATGGALTGGQSPAFGTGGATDATGGQSPASDTGGAANATGGVSSSFPDAQSYVDAHNAVRAMVTEPAGYPGNWAPLPPVTWSDEVAAGAQEWANHLRDALSCRLEHSSGSGYGENLAMGTQLGPQGAVELWASEGSGYVFSTRYAFDSNLGHYTQIVWRDSTTIGCASADCARATVVVCRYAPPGNFIGEQIY